MTKSSDGRFIGGRARRRCVSACVSLCALAVVVVALAVSLHFAHYNGGGAGIITTTHAASRRAAVRAAAQEDSRLDIHLRSFTPGATGRLTIEASDAGGRGRLTALNLPDPQTFTTDARTYVVWATSEGRMSNLGELRRDERGNGGLAFERPADFDHYSIIVTAEPRADVTRPGSPVLSTRANEAVSLFTGTPTVPTSASATTTTDTTNTSTTPSSEPATPPAANIKPVAAPPVPRVSKNTRPRRHNNANGGSDFYAEVDDALAAQGGGRVMEFEGTSEAPKARGSARATTHTGSAYVRANFRGVPLPSAIGASNYILWAIVPDGRIIYMGSLPVTDDINTAEVFVRTAGFGTDIFNLFVTAERQRPTAYPSDRRVLTNKTAQLIK